MLEEICCVGARQTVLHQIGAPLRLQAVDRFGEQYVRLTHVPAT